MHKHNDKTINPCIPTVAEDHENDLPPEKVKLIYKLEFMERCFTVKIARKLKNYLFCASKHHQTRRLKVNMNLKNRAWCIKPNSWNNKFYLKLQEGHTELIT